MDGWPVRDRVVMGCLSGVWQKVPEERWRGWLDAFRNEYGSPEPGRFPPDHFEFIDDANDRTAALAGLLGQRVSTLRVWIHRGKERLWRLSYVQDRLA